MYLKSLTLKGFKSFADRTVMKFEPGVAAIVGPNGSGKSNISDAVLWVLGERNAKNLRGQSMEDVIFAGSSARKSVSVAEVELLLDNSDGTLPVDFAEVSIGRRMYRSGESEYLINGTVVRRMDVLDILHDSGLGTATNSIISQGNLDSVLSSRPEDRRALIEEAAGILKHKERKAKSERKLAQMDAHLDRVHDITAEVERQLKPLERKAKKARTYQALRAELADLTLRIAVDDLRTLQGRWDATLAQEAELSAAQSKVAEELAHAEDELDALQQQLHDCGSHENDLNERYRRAQSSFERLNSTVLVVREKRNGFLSEAERLTRFVEEGRVRRLAAERELEEAWGKAEEARVEYDLAQQKLQRLEADHGAQVDERNTLRKRVDALMAEQRALIHRQETIQATQEALRENLSDARARAQVIDAQVIDARRRLDAARAQEERIRLRAEQLCADHERVCSEDVRMREELNALIVQRDRVRHALDEARQGYTHASAECAALEEFERASESANPLLAHIVENRGSLAPGSQLLTHALKAPAELDGVVEAFLGPDIQGLLVESNDQALRLVDHALEGNPIGNATLFSAEACREADAHDAPLPYRRLIDEVEIDPAHARSLNVLLGDVYIVDTLSEALAAQRASARSCCFASLDGALVWGNGRVSITRLSEDDRKNSALARRRALEAARKNKQECERAYESVQQENAVLEENLRSVQTNSLKLSEQVAQLKGSSESAMRDAQQSLQALRSLEEESARLMREQQENAAFLEKARPDSDGLERDLAQVLADLSSNKEQVAAIEKSLSPLRRTIVSLSEQLSDARLEAARLSERLAYAQRMERTREQEISSSTREDEVSRQRIATARGAAMRSDGLIATLSSLCDAASLMSLRLEQESRDEQQRSRSLHDRIAQATRTSREVRDRFEGFSSRLSDVRIEKGRLEIQVDAGVKAIVEDHGMPLERALAVEVLEDRESVAARAASLERRIKSMGSINPDAAEEFEEVSQRYQYLSAQLEDMRLARRSLARIVNVIDDRMRNDFVATFEQVNANFSEIFSTLFPGGQAHLSLVDPDDLEHTGVDVNAQPVGKRVKKMSLLSGGEKSMTAMALLFAVYRIRQTPFYILDEVEAALDDTNLRRLIAYLQVIRDETQFIMITHQRRTMESADILYGVSMQADGITKVMSQKLDNAQRKEG